ncbi:SAM-dependent methyltransferase [Streptomyces sp. NPDC005931]|uniref:SAM-dependent methyltransferase n=1 Tax=Streptomyces sp. NPDC005931 TaxID=3364737 RepID=UPI00368159CF
MTTETAGTARTADEWRGWRAASRDALYGPRGFYRGPEGPAGHFRTSVHASPLFAEAVARLLCRVDEALGRPAALDFVDMAAGRGELVTGVLAALPAEVAARTRAYAVELAGRPDGLDDRIRWRAEPPERITGLLFANEWLDNVPLEVAEVDPEGVPRLVQVRRDGTERLGDPVTGADAQWLARWWPLRATGPATAGEPPTTDDSTGGAPSTAADAKDRPASAAADAKDRPASAAADAKGRAPSTAADAKGRAPSTAADSEGGAPSTAAEGLRAEIGAPRDEAWAAAVAAVGRGLAVAVDYAHATGSRPPFGTLTGFRRGRETAPVPDGSCDITAHVALDACAAACGLPGARLLPQRDALRSLGVTGARPPLALASSDPAGYVRALASAGEAAELTAPGGLGDFGWLVQPVGIPDVLAE